MLSWMPAPYSTPASAETPRAMPSLTSTCPYLARFMAPTSALGNLWHMLLATAIRPGTPRLIMPGVSTKAPPEPMKPLTRPPTKPMAKRYMIFPRERPMNCVATATASCMLLAPLGFRGLDPEDRPEVAGERAVDERKEERGRDR